MCSTHMGIVFDVLVLFLSNCVVCRLFCLIVCIPNFLSNMTFIRFSITAPPRG